MIDTKCPDREQLEHFASGKAGEETLDAVGEHIEGCVACQAALDTIDDAKDTLEAALLSAPPADGCEHEPEYRMAVLRAKALGGGIGAPGGETTGLGGRSQLGEYRLLENLGGGMGVVYKAFHENLQRTVALKVLPKGRVGDENAIARFSREMQAVGRLNHPNIVQAFDAREIDGTPVLVTEFVDGFDLSRIVRCFGPQNIDDACELVRQAALALQCAHEHGLVHRDVKPSNLMLTADGQVKLLDLGLALLHAEQAGAEEMTDSNLVMGTAEYMAPEQVTDSHDVDIRADIYSLGCTLYKLLSGRAPFSGPEHDNRFNIMQAHVNEIVPPIGKLRDDAPQELGTVLARMLAKDPADRFATPAEVAEAVAPLAAGADLSALATEAEATIGAAGEEGSARRAARPRLRYRPASVGRRWTPWLVALALLPLGVILGVVITINGTRLEVPDGSDVNVENDGDISVATETPQEAKTRSDLERMQGTWEVVKGWNRGKPTTEGAGMRITISGNKLRGTYKGVTREIEFALNEKKKQIDHLSYLSNGTPDVDRAIYRIEGDTLTIVGTGRLRPLAFEMREGGARSGLVYKRVKPDADAVAVDWKPDDRKMIQGTWECVAAERDGKPYPKAVGDRLVFEGDWVSRQTMQDSGMGPDRGTYELRYWLFQTVDPKRMNTIACLCDGRAWDVDKSTIYSLEGDTLKVCVGDGEQRPTEFETKEGDSRQLLIYKRVRTLSSGEDENGATAATTPERVANVFQHFVINPDYKPPGSKRESKDRREWVLMGWLKQGEPDVDGAIADMTKKIGLEPGNADYYGIRADLYKFKNELDLAVKDYSDSLRLKSTATGCACRGEVYLAQGEKDKALDDFNQAIKLDGEAAIAYRLRAECYREMGRLEDALADCKTAIQLEPKRAEYYFIRAGVFGDLKRLDEALADYNKAIQLAPVYSRAYFFRAAFYLFVRKDWDSALRDFSKVIELDHDGGEGVAALQLRAQIYAKQGKRDEALADQDELIRMMPESAPWCLERGKVHLRFGELDKAKEDFQKATQLDPELAPAYLYLGRAFSDVGDRDNAMINVNKALGLAAKLSDKDRLRAYSFRAAIHLEASQLDLAVADFSEVIRLAPDYASAYTDRAFAYFVQAKNARAAADRADSEAERAQAAAKADTLAKKADADAAKARELGLPFEWPPRVIAPGDETSRSRSLPGVKPTTTPRVIAPGDETPRKTTDEKP